MKLWLADLIHTFKLCHVFSLLLNTENNEYNRDKRLKGLKTVGIWILQKLTSKSKVDPRLETPNHFDIENDMDLWTFSVTDWFHFKKLVTQKLLKQLNKKRPSRSEYTVLHIVNISAKRVK